MYYVVARRTAIRAMLAAALIAATAACAPSSANKAGPASANTVRTEPPRTTTTNPYAVPAVVDVAYVNRIMAGLDAAMGDTVRLVVRTRTIPREAYDRLKAIYYDDQRLQLAIDSFQDDMRTGFATYKSDPGNKVSIVAQLITVMPTCIFARVNRDYSAVGANSGADIHWIALRPLDSMRDPQRYNRTNWALSYEGYTESRSGPPDPCAS